ncbi:MAG: penicillin-binding transpeptidase domain-containing protein [Myxococcota bacterium]
MIYSAFLYGQEVPGLVLPPPPAWNLPVPDWGQLRPEARPWAAGLGIEASLLHLAVAYAAVANDGRTRWPSADGTGESLRALRALSARAVKDALRAAVREGTGTNARVEGVDVGGKTGTARLEDGRAALFAGFFPPGRVAVVRVEGGPELTGGSAAAPVFAALVRRLAQR